MIGGIMNKYFILFFCLILLISISFFIFYNDSSVDNSIKNDVNIESELQYKLYFNDSFGYHNTSERTDEIEYIVIHYTGAEMDAKDFVSYYNKPTSVYASADYFVGFNGDVYKYNLEIENRYSWAVGGTLITDRLTYGGSYYGVVTNNNSISIEMCAYSGGAVEANEPGWIISNDTITSTVNLTKDLMNIYNIPIANVVRHYDVTGKWCPGVVGWNENTSNIDMWIDFKNRLE